MAVRPVAPSRAASPRPPSLAAVKAFLTTAPRGETPIARKMEDGWLLDDTRLNAHGAFTANAAGGFGTSAERKAVAALERSAPAWLAARVKEPLSVHRVAAFELPGPGHHRLWFVETQSYKAGFFVDGSPLPAFIFEPRRFRAAAPGETLWPEATARSRGAR
ncbi:MAG: hypothetical protein K1X89_21010 [Myxococcaceae bacterium]|nr:hypothetical protein [Myxococcaceae bacterium]